MVRPPPRQSTRARKSQSFLVIPTLLIHVHVHVDGREHRRTFSYRRPLVMDILQALKDEDDNPRGQGGGRFLNGATSLEEAAENEARKREIRKSRWSRTQQEAGILELIQAKTLFARLRLPAPKFVDGAPHWDVRREHIDRAYDSIKKCCHPEWSTHPKRERGWELLREAMDTLTDANGRRDAYIREIAEREREREALLRAAASSSSSSGPSGAGVGARASVAAAAAEAAAEMERGMAEKRKRLLQEKLRRSQEPRSATASRARDDDDNDDDDEDDGSAVRPPPSKASKPKPKRRPGFM